MIPYFGYSTMERAVLPGEVVTAKINVSMLSSIPNTGDGNVFLMLDLHTAGIIHYFEGPCIRMELYAESALIEGIKRLQLQRGTFMFASADLGRPLWVQTFARYFDTGIAFIRKSRQYETVKIVDVIGDVENKHVIIYDDMTRSASTLINAAEAYMSRGALSCYAVLSHLALNNDTVVDKLLHSPIIKILATNSHQMSQCSAVKSNPDRFLILDISSTFEMAIRGFYR